MDFRTPTKATRHTSKSKRDVVLMVSSDREEDGNNLERKTPSPSKKKGLSRNKIVAEMSTSREYVRHKTSLSEPQNQW